MIAWEIIGQKASQAEGIRRLVEQGVLDCLDHYLASHSRQARIDTTGEIVARELVLKFEERAKKEVKRQLQYVPAAKRRPVHIFSCEDQSYGAFAVRDRYDYIVLHIGIVPRTVEFFDRMMANTGLWTSRPVRRTTVFALHLLWCS